ncbi:hypothetical protein [Thiomonas sp.]
MTNEQWLLLLHKKQFITAVFGVAAAVFSVFDPHLPSSVLPAVEGVLITLIAAFGYQAGQHAKATEATTTKAG